MGLPFPELLAAPFIVGLLLLSRPKQLGTNQLVGAPEQHRQHAGRWRVRAIRLGLAAAALLTLFPQLTPQRTGLLLAGPVFGVCVVAGVLVSELRVERPNGVIRTAVLTPRRIRDHMPRRYGPLLGVSTLALTALLTTIVTLVTRLAGADGFIHATCSSSSPEYIIARSDILPTVIGALVSVVGGAGLCLLAMRKIVARPAFLPDPAASTADHALRRAATETVTLAWGCLVTSSLLAAATLAAVTLDPLASCHDAVLGMVALRAVIYALAAGSAAALVHLLIRLTRLTRLPSPRET